MRLKEDELKELLKELSDKSIYSSLPNVPVITLKGLILDNIELSAELERLRKSEHAEPVLRSKNIQTLKNEDFKLPLERRMKNRESNARWQERKRAEKLAQQQEAMQIPGSLKNHSTATERHSND